MKEKVLRTSQVGYQPPGWAIERAAVVALAKAEAAADASALTVGAVSPRPLLAVSLLASAVAITRTAANVLVYIFSFVLDYNFARSSSLNTSASGQNDQIKFCFISPCGYYFENLDNLIIIISKTSL